MRSDTIANRRWLLFAALSLAAGIALAHILFGSAIRSLWCILIGGVCTPLLCLLAKKKMLAFICIVCFACMSLGNVLYHRAAPIYPTPPLDRVYVSGRVVAVHIDAAYQCDYDLADAYAYTSDNTTIKLQGVVRATNVNLPSIALPGQTMRLPMALVFTPSGVRNPGGWNARMYYFSEQVSYLVSSYELASLAGKPSLIGGTLVKVRIALFQGIDRLWPEDQVNAMVRGLLFGDTSKINDDLRDAFSVLGIAHILSTSGLHVGFVVLLLQGLAKLLFRWIPKRYAYLWSRAKWIPLVFTCAGLFLYAAICGFSASIVRATIMAYFLLIAQTIGIRQDGFTTLGGAALLILLMRPMDLFSVSFQLSFSAVVGIMLLYQPFLAFAQRMHLPKWLASSICLSLSAQLSMIPILAKYFGKVPVLGLLANLFAIPLAGAIVMIGLPCVLLQFVSPLLASIPAYLVTWCAKLLMRLTEFSIKVPLVSVNFAAPTMAIIFLYFILLILLSPAGRTISKRIWSKAVLVSAGASVVAVVSWGLVLYPLQPVVTVLDVNEGHSSVLRYKDLAILVDAGNTRASYDAAVHYNLTYTVFLTHGDLDHAGALANLIEKDRVESIYLSTTVKSDKFAIAEVLAMAKKKECPIYYVGQGDSWTDHGLYADFFVAPVDPSKRKENDAMLVVSVGTGATPDVLFTGDLGIEEEARLVLPQSRVLQVAHHGSNYSTSSAFLAQIRPLLSIIPVGRNTYGHPGEFLMERLRASGTQIERTDLSGAIEVVLGKELGITRLGRER